MGAEWFRRLGDVPGLDYTPPVAVARTTLPRYDAEPEVRRFEFDDGVLVSLSWGMKPYEAKPGAMTSLGSPATEHMREALEEGWAGGEFWPTEPLLQRLFEALELPGEPQDYHRALVHVQAVLANRKLAEPAVLDAMESLARLDVRLLLAYPHFTREVREGGNASLGNTGFNALVQLYRGEGFLRDALEVAELQQERFPGSNDYWLNAIQKGLETIRSERAEGP